MGNTMKQAVQTVAKQIAAETGLRAVDTKEIMTRAFPRSDWATWHAELAASGVRTLRTQGVVYVVVG